MKINQFSRHFLAKFYYEISSLLFSFLITKIIQIEIKFHFTPNEKRRSNRRHKEQKSITNISTCYVGSQLLLMT